MTPEAFIDKWARNTRHERAASQEHFIDLCQLLGEPTPNEADPTGSFYAFEKGATKAAGGNGWADVWKRHHFAIEYKGRHKDLNAAYRQLQNYMLALESPPLLAVCDMNQIIIRTNWTNTVSKTYVVLLDELIDPARLRWLKWMMAEPDRLRPEQTRAALTDDAAQSFAELAETLRRRDHDPLQVAHFINRLVFCLFADDVDLLPTGLFDKLLTASHRDSSRFQRLAGDLFRAMKDRNGLIGFDPVPWFNGGLFDDDATLPLVRKDIELLRKASVLDWGEIDPSIFGTLFERGLDPTKRGQLGAHYTDRDKIMLIIEPVIIRPWLDEWEACRKHIAEGMQASEIARAARRFQQANRLRGEVETEFRRFLDRLRRFRVLDPACGSGNFLYLALLALKDIELRVGQEAEALGLQREFPQIGPEVVHGIELNSYAAELARVSVWIGAIQWARRNGLPHPEDPILQTLDTIECRDAVLGSDGAPASWPLADVIIGNPPFMGDKVMIRQLGADYTERLRRAYAGRVPGAANLVCYWFERACEMLDGGQAVRAGLVATQSIRNGASRQVLDRIARDARIFDAWDDEPWVLDGADVRVSLICFGQQAGEESVRLDGRPVPQINADLSAGQAGFLRVMRLHENLRLCFQGPVKVGAFDVPGELARQWLEQPANPSGRRNQEVLRPWLNGNDVRRRPADKWIIDFADFDEGTAAQFAGPFAHVLIHVQPARSQNRRPHRRLNWWLHGETGIGFRQAIAPLRRYIATVRVSRHRIFVWCPATTFPDSRIYAIAREDDTSFGILHSRFHEAWALRFPSRHGVGNDPTYNNQTCFETFPFPPGLTPDRPAAAYEADPHAQRIAQATRALVAARDRWLNPPEWVEEVAEVIPGLPPRLVPNSQKAAQRLKTRTLTQLYNGRGTPDGRWLDDLHAALDAAVAEAYGWPVDITEADFMERLLVLNGARPAAGAAVEAPADPDEEAE